MKVRVETKISKYSQNFTGSGYGTQAFNHVEAFDCTSFKTEEYLVKNADKNIFVLGLTEICEDVSKINSIVVYCGTQVTGPLEAEVPVKFDIALSNDTLTVSSFSMVNIENAILDNVSFSNFQIPDNKDAILVIAISYK